LRVLSYNFGAAFSGEEMWIERGLGLFV